MAVYKSDNRSRGSMIGSQIGAGLSEGIQRLAQSKMQALEQRNTAKELQNWVDEPTANFLSKFSPQEQFQALQSLIQPGTGGTLSDMMSTGLGGQQPNISQDQMGLIQPQNRQQGTPINARQLLAQQQAQPVQAPKPGLGSVGSLDGKPRKASPVQIQADKAYNASLDEGIANAKQLKSSAEEYLALLDTGKVDTGFTGAYLPNQLQNKETEQANALSEELAGMLLKNFGTATNAKIKFARNQKPNPGLSADSQRKLAERLIKKADKVIQEGNIRDELILSNNNETPSAIKQLVGERLKALGNDNDFDFEVGQDLQELPSKKSAQYNAMPMGTEIEDEEKGIVYTKDPNAESGWKKTKRG